MKRSTIDKFEEGKLLQKIGGKCNFDQNFIILNTGSYETKLAIKLKGIT
jgi:hypothetical protein